MTRVEGHAENNKSTCVLLLNLGGPDSLQAVRPFLYNLFSDREIIRLGPSFLQKPLAWLISTLRHGKTEEFYRQIGGKSPIREITMAQAEALEESLRAGSSTQAGAGCRVFFAMRYWHPLIEEVIPVISQEGISRIFALSLYPHYSVATTGSSLSKLNEVAAEFPIETFSVPAWFDHPLYVEALVEKIRKGIELFSATTPVHVLFSAHSLPEKFILEGDPYVGHIKGTIDKITKKLDIPWDLAYQSKSGPVKWLEPSTDAMIERLAEKGIRNILVVPISFVSDHIETLYEIDLLYRGLAWKSGVRLERTESLNTSPLFISALNDIVQRGLRDAGWER